jgi:FkbM family methyltransferase
MATSLNLCSSGKTQSPVCDIPGRPFQGVKAFAILLLDRWNDHFPIRWQPKIRFSMMHHGRPINVAASMANREYCCFRELFLQGVCDHPLGNPETILGANCGFATLLFAARYPKARIAAVEPHPNNLAALRENLNLNNVRAEVIQAAAAIIDGPVSLMIRTSMSHGLIHRGLSKVEGHPTVSGISISTLLSQLGWDRIDVLKVDIEGYSLRRSASMAKSGDLHYRRAS